MPVTIQIKDKVSPFLAGLISRLKSVNQVIGRAAQQCTQAYLFKLDAERKNKLDGDRQHFYSSAAKATSFTVDPDGVTVVVAWLGIAQRYYGGDIYPVNKQALTIPACADAYGHSAKDFNDLHIERFASGKAALVKNDRTKISIGKRGVKNKGTSGGEIMFWLLPHVHQDPDPTILPTQEAYEESIKLALEPYLKGDK